MKILLKILWLIWYVGIWFFASVFVLMAYHAGGLYYVVLLLVLYWLTYLLGVWFDVPFLANSSWAMLLGYAFGLLILFDKLHPNQQQYPKWLDFVPKSFLGAIGLAFFFIFVGILPAIARAIVKAYKTPRL